MSVSQATVELLFKARNLADSAVSDVVTTVGKVGDAGVTAASKFAGAFRGMGGALSNAIGNATETLASGGSFGEAASQAGIYMAGQLAESFGGQMIERLASSGLIAALSAPLAAAGTAIGGLIAAAIPIGMALLPVILIGAIVAAIAFLIANPDIAQKIGAFVGDMVGKIAEFLGNALKVLGDVIPKAFAAAWDLVIKGVGMYINLLTTVWIDIPKKLIGLGGDILRTIVNGLSGLPGKIWDIITSAFTNLRIDIGPFHITGRGITVDMPKIDLPHFAGGVTNFSGGMAVVGERGPEIVRLPAGSDVIPNGRQVAAGPTGAGVSVRLEGVSEDQLLDMVERGLYVRLRSAGTAY